MPTKLAILCVAVAAFGAVGCSGVFVPKETYDTHVAQLKDYIEALERDNAAMRPKADAYDGLSSSGAIIDQSNKAYADLAASLKAALEGSGVQVVQGVENDWSIGSQGQLVLAGDLLFKSGSFDVTPDGQKVLTSVSRKFPGSQFRVVGHTDKQKVVRVSTKEKLRTDTNLELSMQRSLSVAEALMKSGSPERTIWAEGRGSAQTKGSDKDSRRVEIFIVDEAKK